MGQEGTSRGPGGSCTCCSRDLPARGDQGSPRPYPRPLPQPPWTISSHNAGRAMQWPCGCGWTTPRTTSTRGEWGWAGLGGGAVLRAGFRWSPWQTAGHSSSPLEEVTASLRHEAEHPLATSSRPQPGLSWAGDTSPVPMGAAVSTDLIPVSPSPLGTLWQRCGHMAGTAGAGNCGGHSVSRCLLPTARSRGLAGLWDPTCAHSHSGATFGPGLGLGASACSVCSWHSVTLYPDPSQAVAVAFRTCSRQVASPGCASLPLLGVPGTWSSPRPTEGAQGTVL